MIGYIYKIYDNTNGNIYYGSTIEPVPRRIASHRAKYKQYIIEGKGSYTRSFDIFRNMDYSYSVVEKVEFNEKYELKQRERFYIENNECVNKNIPNRTEKEYKEINKEHYKEIDKIYRENNKDKIKEKQKEYREKNKDKISIKSKEYREKNEEKIKKDKKDYYEKNKDRINEKLKEKGNCPHCNKEMRKDSLPRHIKNVCKKINNVD